MLAVESLRLASSNLALQCESSNFVSCRAAETERTRAARNVAGVISDTDSNDGMEQNAPGDRWGQQKQRNIGARASIFCRFVVAMRGAALEPLAPPCLCRARASLLLCAPLGPLPSSLLPQSAAHSSRRVASRREAELLLPPRPSRAPVARCINTHPSSPPRSINSHGPRRVHRRLRRLQGRPPGLYVADCHLFIGLAALFGSLPAGDPGRPVHHGLPGLAYCKACTIFKTVNITTNSSTEIPSHLFAAHVPQHPPPPVCLPQQLLKQPQH